MAEATEDEHIGDMSSYLTKKLRERLVDTTQPLHVQRADPDSPLHSVKSFEEMRLRKELLQGIYSMGFTKPSKIQETALPILLADPPQNMLAQSQSGTGKTAAYILAILSRVDPELKYPQALVLSPTYELAVQIRDVCAEMGKFCPEIKTALVVRDSKRPSSRMEEQVVIGTPGTIKKWTQQRPTQCLNMKKIKVFVLDEADVMLSLQGHSTLTISLRRMIDPSCQTILFSATYDQSVIEFAPKIASNLIKITLRKEEESLDNIRQVYIVCRSTEEKYECLSYIYGVICIGQSIIFCQTRKTAYDIAMRMVDEGMPVALLTGELDVERRMAILRRFRNGMERLLITTNVCSRGLDIAQVTLVINYDLPYDVINRRPDYESYLHRIGRSGRFGHQGLAVNFVDDQRSLENLMAIEKHFGRPIEKLNNSFEDIEKLEAGFY